VAGEGHRQSGRERRAQTSGRALAECQRGVQTANGRRRCDRIGGSATADLKDPRRLHRACSTLCGRASGLRRQRNGRRWGAPRRRCALGPSPAAGARGPPAAAPPACAPSPNAARARAPRPRRSRGPPRGSARGCPAPGGSAGCPGGPHCGGWPPRGT